MLQFLLQLCCMFKEKCLSKFDLILNLICFYRHPLFHNYLALLYFIVGLRTVLYVRKISIKQFVIQLGFFPAVAGRFWYDVFPEFISNSPSKRVGYFFLEELFDTIFLLYTKEESVYLYYFDILDFYFTYYYLWAI